MSTIWNPELYLKFQKERAQPSIDLVSRIDLDAPELIIDVGCGPGNSTHLLWERWPEAAVAGLDSSEQMVNKAKSDYPDREWRLADVRDLPVRPSFDLVFSNATIQWIPDHEELVPRLLSLVRPGGALAVQMPLYHQMPMYDVVRQAAGSDRWSDRMDGCEQRWSYHGMEYYYDLLAPHTRSLSLWQTWYAHEMQSHESIVEMMSSTGLRQYLEQLDGEEETQAFKNEVLKGTREAYPARATGRVLYPFKRVFWIAHM
jgi:trans-aconitate 2-methyltransferase